MHRQHTAAGLQMHVARACSHLNAWLLFVALLACGACKNQAAYLARHGPTCAKIARAVQNYLHLCRHRMQPSSHIYTHKLDTSA